MSLPVALLVRPLTLTLWVRPVALLVRPLTLTLLVRPLALLVRPLTLTLCRRMAYALSMGEDPAAILWILIGTDLD